MSSGLVGAIGGRQMTADLYVRVSTLDQNLGNQLDDLRKYVARRGWP